MINTDICMHIICLVNSGIAPNINKLLSTIAPLHAIVEVFIYITICYQSYLYNYQTGGCDGTKKNPEIARAPPEDYHAGVGSTVILQWTYCKTRESSITGIIISREALRKRSYLLAIDTAGKTTYYQATHQHYNITWIKKNGSITFIIMNISMSDAGHYTLEIRRVGYVDLEKRVNVVVRMRAGLMLIIYYLLT